MFKLESYITPIILNHVAKYVKNIRPQDAQVSLWEGEVAFQNLDLRLDVLEEELNLPFEFLSGHIHELAIRVPWTKITSDPIIITINTIEFVLKLKDPNAEGSPSSPRRSDRKKRAAKVDDAQGYMPGLVNRIINNIVVNCHNIILKYVEEDIVVSMNVQYLSFASANEQWEPTFIDVNPVKVLMRKLVKISDLTICLDKRNSLGQIEVCQEPILYRCSLDVRIFRKQNNATAGTPITTRVGIFTKLMEMNISSMQFPMVMRLLNLVFALKSGRFKAIQSEDESIIHDEESEESNSPENPNDSYLNWAWNLIPNFSIEEDNETSEEAESTGSNIFEMGLYLETLNFTLKSSDFITDSIVGATKKIRYSPILKCTLEGIFSETLMADELNWSNTKAGVSKVTVEPVGMYVDEVAEMNSFITSQTTVNTTYLNGGLFDEIITSHENMNFVTDLESHNNHVTDNYLFHRSPAMAFDLVSYKDNIEIDTFASRSSEIAIEEAIDKSIMRVLAGSMTLGYNSTLLRVISVVEQLIATYDYPPYFDEKTDMPNSPKLHPPLLDDFDSLMRDIPLKITKFKLKNVTVETFAKFTPDSKIMKQFPVSLKSCIPRFTINFESIDGLYTRPLDVNKLVHTTCQLPEKPNELMSACYDNIKIHLNNVTAKMTDPNGSCSLARIPEVSFDYGDLLLPELWKDDEVTHRKFNLIIDNFNIEFTKPQLIIATNLGQAVSADNLHALHKISMINLKHAMHHAMPRMETKLVGIKVHFQKFRKTLLLKGIMCSVACHMIDAGGKSSPENQMLIAPQTPCPVPWLEWHFEIPNDFASVSRNSVLSVTIENYAIALNSKTLEFFNDHEIEFGHLKRELSIDVETVSSVKPPLIRKSSKKSIPSERISRKISHPEETVHLSSDRDDKLDLESLLSSTIPTESTYGSMLETLKTLLLHVEIDSGKLYLATGDKYQMSSNCGCTRASIPKIVCKSSYWEKIERMNAYNFILAKSVIKDTFPWTFNISDFSIKSQSRKLLHTVQTTITIAMTHKKEFVHSKKEWSTIEELEARKTRRQSRFEFKRSHAGCFDKQTSDADVRKNTNSRGSGSESPNQSRSASPESVSFVLGSDKLKGQIQEGLDARKAHIERNIVTLNLHIDTSPIVIEYAMESMPFITNDLNLLTTVINQMSTAHSDSLVKHEEPFRILTSFEDDPKIKDFMDFETNSASSKPAECDHTQKLAGSFLIQWTVTKFGISMEGPALMKSKLNFEMEDIITTIDKREDFVKLTGKIGTFNTRYSILNAKGDWTTDDSLKIGMHTDSSQSPFFNVILTKVALRNFFDKIGTAKRKGDISRSISEIVATMRAIEVIVDLDKLEQFMPAFASCSDDSKMDEKKLKQEKQSVPLTVADLPMVHFKWKGCTVYLPIKNDKAWCSAAILKVEQIELSSDLENPLQRTPIRTDIYNKAAQMGILNTPGSFIEDRQYELRLKNISAASGNWKNISNHMKEYTDNFHNTNPAFEWNNQGRRTSMELRQIFHNFTFMTTYAPCIVYRKILICGPSIEFNCSKDFICELTNDQINLIVCLAVKLQNVNKSTSTTEDISQHQSIDSSHLSLIGKHSSKNLHLKSSESLVAMNTFTDSKAHSSTSHKTKEPITDIGKPATDSGFYSIEKSKSKSAKKSIKDTKSLPILTNQYERHIPYSIAFVAGIFLFKFYNFSRKRISDMEYMDSVTPLILLTISQPTFIISQTIYEYSVNFSLFNMNINLHKVSTEEDIANLDGVPPEFNVILFDTKRGELSQSGIPPSLVTLKYHLTKSKKVEVDLIIAKPANFSILDDSLENVTRVCITLYESFLENDQLLPSSPRTIARGTKVQLIRNSIYNADHFYLNLNKIAIRFSKSHQFDTTLTLTDVMVALKYSDRPEKLNAKGSIGAIYVQTETKVVLHPVGVKINTTLVQESWHNLPLVTANLKFNVVQIDIGIDRIQNFVKASSGMKKTLEAASGLWENFLERRAANYKDVNRANLEPLPLPEIKQKRMGKQCDEFYQDDLRAGAFQFVEMNSDDVLPMPYQIQIIKKNYGIICWRYPQPRKMRKVFIYPVPMAVSNPIQIKCHMEYYSETHESFLHFCNFYLSETDSNQIDLPDRMIAANIWRVVILQSIVSVNGEYFDTSEDDEEMKSISTLKIESVLESAKEEKDFILHPKVLVGCMRIDTSFNPTMVPKTQILLSAILIQLNLQNHQNPNVDSNIEKPQLLKKYKIKPQNHDKTFLSIVLANTNLHTSFLTRSNYQIQNDMIFSIKVLDYSYLNMLYLIEETKINSYLSFSDVIDVNVIADKIRMNIGPAVLHTLLTSRRFWTEGLDNTIHKKKLFFQRFVVINRLDFNISFGQSNTTEKIELQAQECTAYSFRSDFYDQKLTFYAANNETGKVDEATAVPIILDQKDEPHVDHVRIGNKCLVVKTKKLSSTQVAIFIKGQIELVSMVSTEFKLQFRKTSDNSSHVLSAVHEYTMEPNDKVTFYQEVVKETEITMRLRFKETQSKGWTGDIPLKPNKSYPWLVKVPIPGTENFTSFWVRILRHDIPELCTETFKPQQILITIWPIFQIRSMLTYPLNGYESLTNGEFRVNQNGGFHQLKLPATHQTDHDITFTDEFLITNEENKNFNLSLKAIDWNRFFWYDEALWSVEKSLTELGKSSFPKWPLADDEEMRIKRMASKCCTTVPEFKCYPSRDWSCTLSLEITPSVTFINSTGLMVAFRNKDSDIRIIAQSNEIAMLPPLHPGFVLEVENGPNWHPSLPIFFDRVECPKRAENERYLLQTDSSIMILLRIGDNVHKLFLKSINDNGRKMLILKPAFVVTNFCKSPLVIRPFCLEEKEQTTRQAICDIPEHVESLLPNTVVKGTSNGTSLEVFFDINYKTHKRSNASTFAFFICFKSEKDSEISVPIDINSQFNRKCFSLQYREKSIPLTASLLIKDDIRYLNIFEDRYPGMEINNQTELAFVIGQTNASENSKVSSTFPEYDGRHFTWHQVLRPRSHLFYTPPGMYNQFPDVESVVNNLALAVYNESPKASKTTKWSKAIQVNSSTEKFLHIPLHGDVKILICDKHRVTRISIQYIAQQLEFSVKDLRSRLLSPQIHDSTEVQVEPRHASDITLRRVRPTNSSQCIHHQQKNCEAEDETPLKIRLFVKEIDANIFINSKTTNYMTTEVFALYVDDFIIDFDRRQRKLDVIMMNLQIDNQLFSSGNYDFPVVLCSRELYRRTPTLPSPYLLQPYIADMRSANPLVLVSFIFYDDEMELQSIECQLTPIRAYIEDTYLNDLFDHLLECEPNSVIYTPKKDAISRIQLVTGQALIPVDIVNQAVYLAEVLKLKSIRIEPMSVLLSVHTCVRMYIALDHSPLEFSAYEKSNLLTLPLSFGHTLGMHYLSGALFGAGWVVGSLEILGSPSGLARSVTTGLRDFVSMPAQGLLRGPWGFVVGVTQGSASLLRNITAGTVNSVTKLASSVARNLDRLTLDDEHIQRTDALRRSRPQGFTQGFAQGLTGLGISILGAVGGIARHTLEARSPVQVVTGMGKGIVGAFAKPISGAAELLALTGQGVLHTVGFNAMPRQRAPSSPRNIAIHPSDSKIWNLLPQVLATDQILFFHEATLVVGNSLKRVSVFLTSTVLAVMEMERDSIYYVIPIDRVEAEIDSSDKTLINIIVRQDSNEFGEDASFTNQRIMKFLRSSGSHHNRNEMTTESLDSLLKRNEGMPRLNWSFYISEHLGQYLLQYLKIIHSRRTE